MHALESTASVSGVRLDVGTAAWVTLKYRELSGKIQTPEGDM